MNGTAEREDITTTVSALSDRRLLERIKELSSVEHHLEVVVIDHLRELHKRRLYLCIGFSSLFDYAVRELGYSDAAAWRRIKAMRLCADIDGVRERLQDGSMTLNVAAQLQNAFDRQERAQERTRGRVAGAGPGQVLARPVESAHSPAPVLDRSARLALVEQAAGKSTRQVQELLAEVDPQLAAPADRVRPLGEGRWEIRAVIDDECRRGLERLKGLLSHVDPHMTPGQLIGRLVREGLHRHDPARPPRRRVTGGRSGGAGRTSAPKDKAVADSAGRSAATAQAPAQPEDAGASPPKTAPDADRPKAGGVPSAPKSERAPDDRAASPTKRPAGPAGDATSPPKAGPRAGRAIPAAGRAIPAPVRRRVWERDQGRCSYVDRDSGRRCDSRYLLEIDHIVPYARGGVAALHNLRLLCAAHHRHRHTGAS